MNAQDPMMKSLVKSQNYFTIFGLSPLYYFETCNKSAVKRMSMYFHDFKIYNMTVFFNKEMELD